MRRLAALLMCMAFAGCGYTTGSLLPSNYRTLHVENFKNKVGYVSDTSRGNYIPLLETKVHDAVVNRFQFDGHLKIKNSDQADLVLTGELIGFERDELRLSDNEDVQEYRIRVIMSLTMTDMATGEPLWTEPSFSGEATYFITGPQAKSEAAALEDALTDLSRRAVERTIENW